MKNFNLSLLAVTAIFFLTFLSCAKENSSELLKTEDLVSNAVYTQAFEIPATEYTAALNGDQQVPAVPTVANGEALIRQNLSETHYAYRCYDIKEAIGAALYLGPAGSNGPMVARLNLESMTNDHMARGEGVLTSQDLMGDLNGNMEMFGRYLKDGRIYISIQTRENPGGEIRGQF